MILLFKLRNTTCGKWKWHFSIFLSSQQNQSNYNVYPEQCEGKLIIHNTYITSTNRLPELALQAGNQQREGRTASAKPKQESWQLAESWRMKPRKIWGETRWMTKSQRERVSSGNEGPWTTLEHKGQSSPDFNNRFKMQSFFSVLFKH